MEEEEGPSFHTLHMEVRKRKELSLVAKQFRVSPEEEQYFDRQLFPSALRFLEGEELMECYKDYPSEWTHQCVNETILGKICVQAINLVKRLDQYRYILSLDISLRSLCKNIALRLVRMLPGTELQEIFLSMKNSTSEKSVMVVSLLKECLPAKVSWIRLDSDFYNHDLHFLEFRFLFDTPI